MKDKISQSVLYKHSEVTFEKYTKIDLATQQTCKKRSSVNKDSNLRHETAFTNNQSTTLSKIIHLSHTNSQIVDFPK